MTAHFAKVWKATAYCRTEGVLAAADETASLWLPVERPVACDVRIQQGVDSSWTASDSWQDWVDDARCMAEHLGFASDVRVTASFRLYPVKEMGVRSARAAAIACVKAVAKAAEIPVSPQSLLEAETALGDPTGLSFSAAGIAREGSFEVLGVERYQWLYARPVEDIAPTGPCGRAAMLAADSDLLTRLGSKGEGSGVREVLLEVAERSGVTVLAVAGGMGEAHPAALLLERTHHNLTACQSMSSWARETLGGDWMVGSAQSAVPELEWIAED